MCAYQRVRNFSFSENLANVLNQLSLTGCNLSRQTFACSKSTIETLEKGVKYVQS